MKESRPLVFAIKGNALDDGPGIRSVVFIKGCPLSCLWCHNPEGKKRQVEIGFDAAECIACDSCIAACPNHALRRDHPFFVDRAACSLCFLCEQACPSGAIRHIGDDMAVDQIIARVIRDQPFYDVSGGGVTLSGGEPTLFPDFASALVRSLRARGIHALLETCGLFHLAEFDVKLYPWLDLIYFDLKLMDNQAHIHYCGAPNETILHNFRELARRATSGGVRLLPRIPLIPGITATEQNLRAIADFLLACGTESVQLLPYHPLWQEKNRMLGIEPGLDPGHGLDSWLSSQALAGCRSIVSRAGLSVL